MPFYIREKYHAEKLQTVRNGSRNFDRVLLIPFEISRNFLTAFYIKFDFLIFCFDDPENIGSMEAKYQGRHAEKLSG